MNKKTLLIAASAVGIILVGILIYMNTKMRARQEENEQMIEVLKMDKAEMENDLGDRYGVGDVGLSADAELSLVKTLGVLSRHLYFFNIVFSI